MQFLLINKFAEYLGRFFFVMIKPNREFPKIQFLKLCSVLEGYYYSVFHL